MMLRQLRLVYLGLQDDPDVREGLYELFKLGLLNVFSVHEKPRFCWDGALVCLLGIVQIVGGYFQLL